MAAASAVPAPEKMFQQIGSLKVTYSVHTQAGADLGGNVKDNQDAWCVQERLAGQDMAMFGVFDGHGQEGKVVSHSVCTNVPKALAKYAACKVGMEHPGWHGTSHLRAWLGRLGNAAGMQTSHRLQDAGVKSCLHLHSYAAAALACVRASSCTCAAHSRPPLSRRCQTPSLRPTRSSSAHQGWTQTSAAAQASSR